MVTFTGFLRLCAALSSKVRMSNDLKNKILARNVTQESSIVAAASAFSEKLSEKEHTPTEETTVTRKTSSRTQNNSTVNPMQRHSESAAPNFDRTLSTASASTIEAALGEEDVTEARGAKKQFLILRYKCHFIFLHVYIHICMIMYIYLHTFMKIYHIFMFFIQIG